MYQRLPQSRSFIKVSGGHVSFKGTHMALLINRDGEVAFKGRCPKCQSGHEKLQPDLLLEEHGQRFTEVRQQALCNDGNIISGKRAVIFTLAPDPLSMSRCIDPDIESAELHKVPEITR